MSKDILQEIHELADKHEAKSYYNRAVVAYLPVSRREEFRIAIMKDYRGGPLNKFLGIQVMFLPSQEFIYISGGID